MKAPCKPDNQLPLALVEEIRTRKGNVIYFGDDFRRIFSMRKARRQRVKHQPEIVT